jgi:hypothetical protein
MYFEIREALQQAHEYPQAPVDFDRVLASFWGRDSWTIVVARRPE